MGSDGVFTDRAFIDGLHCSLVEDQWKHNTGADQHSINRFIVDVSRTEFGSAHLGDHRKQICSRDDQSFTGNSFHNFARNFYR